MAAGADKAEQLFKEAQKAEHDGQITRAYVLYAQAAAADHYTLTFQLGDRRAVFDVRTTGTASPLTPGLLQDFRCPGVKTK